MEPTESAIQLENDIVAAEINEYSKSNIKKILLTKYVPNYVSFCQKDFLTQSPLP